MSIAPLTLCLFREACEFISEAVHCLDQNHPHLTGYFTDVGRGTKGNVVTLNYFGYLLMLSTKYFLSPISK